MSFGQALNLIGPTMEQLVYEKKKKKPDLGLVHNHTYWRSCFPDRIKTAETLA